MFGLIAPTACAALGILLKLYDYPLIVFIIAFFLGPQFERSLAQAMSLLRGDPRNLVSFPIAVALLLVAAALLVSFLLRQPRERDTAL